MTDTTADKPARVPVLAGGPIKAIVPADLDQAYRLAKSFVQGGITPRGMKDPSQIMVAILAGLEVGLMPLQAVQGIYVTNGRPQLFGDALIAVVRGSGKVGYIRETFEGSGEDLRAVCETQRKDTGEIVKRSFSWAQAKRAGLAGKEGPWAQYPARMLQMRARNFCLRDAYADVLRGLGNDEEEPLTIEVGHLETVDAEPIVPEAEDAEVTDLESSQGASDDADGPPDPDAESEEEAKEEDPDDADEQALLKALESGLKLAKSAEDVEELWGDMDVESSLTHDPALLATAVGLKAAAMKRVSKKGRAK